MPAFPLGSLPSSASILASARSSHVVAVFRGGDAVAYEHDRTGGFPAEEKFRGRKSSGKCRIVGFADFGIVEAVGPPELGIGGDFEGLIEALAVGRLEAEALEFAGNLPAMKAAAFSSSGLPVGRPFNAGEGKNLISPDTRLHPPWRWRQTRAAGPHFV